MRFRFIKPSTPLVSKLPAKLVSITVLMLMAMVLIVVWARESGNSDVRLEGEARLTTALDNELRLLVLDAIDQTSETEFARKISPATGRGISEDLPLAIFDLTANAATSRYPDAPGKALESRLADDFAKAFATLSTSLRGSIVEHEESRTFNLQARNSASGIVSIESKLFAWAMVPALQRSSTGDSAPVAIVKFMPINTAFETRVALAAKTGFVNLRTAPQTAHGNEYFSYKRGDEAVFVSWQPDRPGDRHSNYLGSLMLSIMAIYTCLVAYHMTRKLSESETEKAHLAVQDTLTGLGNRLLFNIHVEDAIIRAQHANSQFAIFYLDFDRFKEVNDGFGHDAGDILIISAARRLEMQICGMDRLARFSGDEFGILQMDIRNASDCVALAERINKCMHEPFEIMGQKIYLGLSIGIAVSRTGGDDRGELMRRADMALYNAKNRERGSFAFYDDTMNSDFQRKKRLEDDLRMAIKNDELEVFYQPIVSAHTHKLSGVEALVRWTHSELGPLQPHEFIAIAEARGLISSLGQWVLHRACQDAIHWPGLKLAVNISPMQFRHAEFLTNVRDTLEATGFPPNRLELEMTESVVIDDADQAERAIIELRAMGVRLALDDFGTGYSSLIYLRRFAIDKIKIDRSFVDMMEGSNENTEIVRNIADLGCRLGLTVTAEGVENEEQVAILENFGCHELQGYLFGKALSPLQIPLLLAAGKVRAPEEMKASIAA